MTGGGSGGHITPILAVADELKRLRPDAEIVFVGQKGDSLSDVPERHASIDRVAVVRAGKFRRYHGEGIKQLFDLETLCKNLRDAVWVVVGFFQSLRLLGRERPDVVFVKGGFVGVPVGLAAALRRIPYVTHDSDALPGLANRIVAPWAKLHAVALPKEVYASYPKDKVVTVGVPISRHYHKLDAGEIAEWRKRLGLAAAGRVLFVTGGGNGADRLNRAVINCAVELLERYPDLMITHQTGRDLEDGVRNRYKQVLSAADLKRVIVKGFVSNMYMYSGAADVVVARAGANSLAEFAAQAKACVIVPNPQLTGGHQLKNAKVLADRKAVRLVGEDALKDDPRALMPALTDLFDHPDKIKVLGARLSELAQPNASHLLAVVLLEVAEGKALAALKSKL